MLTQELRTESKLVLLATEAHALFGKLLSERPHSADMMQWLQGVCRLIDCMVLGTTEYGLAKLRIRNATRFIEAREFGAAKFEIRQLRGGLKEQLAGAQECSVYDALRHSAANSS